MGGLRIRGEQIYDMLPILLTSERVRHPNFIRYLTMKKSKFYNKSKS